MQPENPEFGINILVSLLLGLVSPLSYVYIGKSLKSSCQELLGLFAYNLAQMAIGRPSAKSVQIILIH